MNILRQIMKWFWKAWPLWAMLIIGWIHYGFYNRFNYNGEYINKIASSTLQIVGGIIVLYSVNENMGMFKRGNLFSLIGQWFKSFPLIRKSVTVHVESCGGIIFGGEATVTTKRKFNTIEEQLDEIERQIGECRQLISDREKVVMERINDVRSKFEFAISQNNREIQDVRKLLDDSVVGSIKAQIFGVFLVIYGAVLSIL